MAEADASDTRPISLFYSYAHEDEELRARLEKHLRFLRRSNLIVEWHDRNIDAGDDWAREIDRNLVSADIILLLVSAGFIASDYCWGEEVTKALARHDRGEARVIPVILRPCRWLSTRLGRLQGLPREGRAVTLWPNVDEAFDDVAAGIERVVGELRERREDAARGSIPSAETFGTPTISRSPTGLTVTQTPAPPDKGLADFQVFRDVAAPWCPELVVIPAGSFLMGSPLNEGGRFDNEGPQHHVTIGHRFGLGRYPVTFEEYDRFWEATGRDEEEEEIPGDQDWGRGKSPVITVTWWDAVAYCEWLTKETGQRYRLPSEAEWEYACRAGTTTPFSFGAEISTDQANYDGNCTYAQGRKGRYRQQTTEVGAFPANSWGLYDMHGNVWEWVEDVRHHDYEGAPADGSAWTEGKEAYFDERVLRGGSWDCYPTFLRSAARIERSSTLYAFDYGFRVARTLLGL